MRTRLALTAAAAAALTLALPSAQAAPDRTVNVVQETSGTGVSTLTGTWTGTAAPGANTSYFLDGTATTGACDASGPQGKCEDTLIRLTSGAKPTKNIDLTFRIAGYAASDFDLRVYASDKDGKLGTYLGSPIGDTGASSPLGTADPRNTFLGDAETTIGATKLQDAYFLVRVVYFTTHAEGYTGTFEARNVPMVPPAA